MSPNVTSTPFRARTLGPFRFMLIGRSPRWSFEAHHRSTATEKTAYVTLFDLAFLEIRVPKRARS